MTEFNPNCGKCGMLNSRGFCSLTACRYPTNVIAVQPTVIRGMMVNQQIEKPMSNGDLIRSMSDYDLAGGRRMSERQEHRKRYNLRLMWIAEFDKWLNREPPMWKFWAWRRWKRERPVWREVDNGESNKHHG